MKKMTKWLAVCAACMICSIPAMAADVPEVTVTPVPIETPAPDITPIETPAPTPEVKNGWYDYGTKKRYIKMVSILQECVKFMERYIISVRKDL